MKITARTASPNKILLRTLSAARTTTAVSDANTAPLTPTCVPGPFTATCTLCGDGSAATGPVLAEPLLASRPQPASTEDANTIPNPPTARFCVANAIATMTIADCTASPVTFSDLRPA